MFTRCAALLLQRFICSNVHAHPNTRRVRHAYDPNRQSQVGTFARLPATDKQQSKTEVKNSGQTPHPHIQIRTMASHLQILFLLLQKVLLLPRHAGTDQPPQPPHLQPIVHPPTRQRMIVLLVPLL